MMAFDKPDHASLTPILLSGLSNHERALPDDLNFNPGHEKQLGDRIAALGDEPADQMAERLRKNIGGIRAVDGPRSEAPATFYNSDEQWRLENEKLFGRTWLLAARAEDVAKRNSYTVWERLGE